MTCLQNNPFFPKTESPSHNSLSAIPACQTGHLSTLRHGDPAHKGFSTISACQSISQPTSNRSHPSVPPGPRHGDPTHKGSSAIPACQSISQPTSNRSHPSVPPGPRHGDPTYKYSRGILAWRRRLLAGLRHGHPANRCPQCHPRGATVSWCIG